MAVTTSNGTLPARTAPWHDPRKRAAFFQSLVLVLVAALIIWIVNNTLTNLARLNIASGYDFLERRAGFGVPMNLVDYSPDSTYLRAFGVGILNTLLVSALGIIASTLIGFFMGVARLSTNWLIRTMAAVYVEGMRNIPVLLQIFFWYFAVLGALPQPRQAVNVADSAFLSNRGLFVPAPVPQDYFWLTPIVFLLSVLAVIVLARWARRRRELTGQIFPTGKVSVALLFIPALVTWFATGAPLAWNFPSLQGFRFVGGLTIVPELVAVWFALSLYTGAFIAEAVRGGILAISKGQTQAARSLGLSAGQTLRLVIIPQAMRIIVPPVTNQYLSLTKNSSLGAAVGYPELMSVSGTMLNQTGQAVEVLGITMLVYGTICLVIALIMNVYNRLVRIPER
ncbi:MAG: amino acid ABC transporter permease [Pseudomonadota bacterium]|nr:amino acid ABC transporter permease [Pseudomonadota bacterium]